MNVKKRITEMIAIVGLFALIISLLGCSSKMHTNSESETRAFSSYSQEERKAYISNVLKSKYNFICSSVSDVFQRQETVFQNEQYYYATVRNDKNELVYVWVDKNGMVFDTVFCLDLNEKINSILHDDISKYENTFAVSAYIEFKNAPKKEWYPTDDMKEMLQSEDIYLFVRVVIDKSSSTDLAVLAERISKELPYCNGIVRIYKCDDVENVEIDSIDLTSYLYSSEFNKR